MQRTRIFLIRHGQVEGHEEKRYNGQANVALTSLGREQSHRVRNYMFEIPVDAVYSSDLDRSSYLQNLLLPRITWRSRPMPRYGNCTLVTGKDGRGRSCTRPTPMIGRQGLRVFQFPSAGR